MSLALPVTTWTQNCFVEIFNATIQSVFDKAFEACFSKDLAVVRNDSNMPREEYKKFLEELKFPQQTASVEFAGLVSFIDGPSHGPLETGLVGGFFDAQVRQGEQGGRPWQLNVLKSSLLADVDNDPAAVSNPSLTDIDTRRIFKLTLVDKLKVTPF